MNSKKKNKNLFIKIVYSNINSLLQKHLSWVYYEKHEVDPHAYSLKICSPKINRVFCSHLCICTKWQIMSHPTHTFPGEMNKVILCLLVSPWLCKQKSF